MVNEDWEPTWEQPYQWCDMPSFNDDDWATFKNRGETIIEWSPNNSIENRWLGKYEF